LQSPWQAPDDLDQQIDDLLQANEPALVARSLGTSFFNDVLRQGQRN